MKYPEKLSELFVIFLEILEKEQIENPDEIAKKLLMAFCEKAGGTVSYYPNTLDRHTRNVKIVNEFNGINYQDLAKKYTMTEVNVRQIIRKFKKNESQIPFLKGKE
jgi:Mor family transcriptional regulator